jgi:WD40 repeat protein
LLHDENQIDEAARDLLFSDESHLASSHDDGSIFVWNFNTGQRVRRVTADAGLSINCMCLLNRESLLTCKYEYIAKIIQVKFWNWSTGQLQRAVDVEKELDFKLASVVQLKKSEYFLFEASYGYLDKQLVKLN